MSEHNYTTSLHRYFGLVGTTRSNENASAGLAAGRLAALRGGCSPAEVPSFPVSQLDPANANTRVIWRESVSVPLRSLASLSRPLGRARHRWPDRAVAEFPSPPPPTTDLRPSIRIRSVWPASFRQKRSEGPREPVAASSCQLIGRPGIDYSMLLIDGVSPVPAVATGAYRPTPCRFWRRGIRHFGSRRL